MKYRRENLYSGSFDQRKIPPLELGGKIAIFATKTPKNPSANFFLLLHSHLKLNQAKNNLVKQRTKQYKFYNSYIGVERMVIMAKKNIIATTITTEYANTLYNLPIEVAQMVSRMIEPYKVENAVATTTTEPKAESKPKAKTEYAKVYEVAKDGKSVTIGNGGFIPTKVFKGVTYSLKQSGAKYDAKTKAWTFDTKKACTEWCKAQDARA